jgi:hypothetical protein
MANGVNYQLSQNTPKDMVDVSQWGGKLRVQYDKYVASSLAAGTISVATLPAGAIVYDVILHTDDMGSSTTAKVGDASDDDRFITSTDTATAAAITRLNASAGFGYEYSATTDIIITTTGTSTGTFKIAIFYTVA